MIETTIDTVGPATPETVTPDAPVTEAAEYLRRTDVSAVPVVEDGNVVGILTASDLVALIAETDDRPAVADVMSTPVTTVTPTTTVHDAVEMMQAAGVRHLPVVDGGTYRGLVGVRSVAPYVSRHRLDIEWDAEPLRFERSEPGRLAASD